MTYHVEPEGCPRCAARLAALEAVANGVIHFARLELPNPFAAAAATGPLEAAGRSRDGLLEADLVEEERDILLEVRTRDAALSHQLVGYSLRGATERALVQGFLVLRPDVERWYAAHTSFYRGALYARLDGRCEEVLIAPVRPQALGAADRQQLLAAIARLDRASQEAWARWLSGAELLAAEETRPLLREMRERLRG